MGAQADLVLRNAKIHTMDETQPWASAFAVQAGKLVAIGSSATVERRSSFDKLDENQVGHCVVAEPGSVATGAGFRRGRPVRHFNKTQGTNFGLVREDAIRHMNYWAIAADGEF